MLMLEWILELKLSLGAGTTTWRCLLCSSSRRRLLCYRRRLVDPGVVSTLLPCCSPLNGDFRGCWATTAWPALLRVRQYFFCAQMRWCYRRFLRRVPWPSCGSYVQPYCGWRAPDIQWWPSKDCRRELACIWDSTKSNNEQQWATITKILLLYNNNKQDTKK